MTIAILGHLYDLSEIYKIGEIEQQSISMRIYFRFLITLYGGT